MGLATKGRRLVAAERALLQDAPAVFGKWWSSLGNREISSTEGHVRSRPRRELAAHVLHLLILVLHLRASQPLGAFEVNCLPLEVILPTKSPRSSNLILVLNQVPHYSLDELTDLNF